MRLIALCLGMILIGTMSLNSKLKKKYVVKTEDCPEIIIINPEGKEESSNAVNSELSRSVPVLDFSNLPSDLALTITNTTSLFPVFSEAELSTISTTDSEARVSLLINKDSLMRRYIHEITKYIINSHALINFDAEGSFQVQVWLVEEGIISNSTNELDVLYFFECCNKDIFNLFIGLSESDVLTSGQQSLKDALYLAVNSETDTNINVAARKYYRIIHPVTTVPTNLPPG